MNPLQILVGYFPTGTTEGERHILRKAFVQTEEYTDLITPPPHSPRIIIGKKGSGKSAIIDFSMTLFSRTHVPAVLIKPMDISLGAIPEGAAVGEITRAALSELTKATASVLGASLSGLISESDKKLYDEAIKKGLAEKDTVGKLSRLLPKLAKSYTSVDLSALLPEADDVTIERLERAIKDNLSQSAQGFYIFIDDTDQVAAPDRPGHLNRIWGFLLAARELCSRIAQVRCIISLREEVWRRLTSDKAGQRDQTDHFQGLTRHLNPTREHISNIVNRRLALAATDIGIEAPNPWPLFFEGDSPKIPTSDERSNWSDLIVVRSRERPRDAVQMINKLAQRAIADDRGTINEQDFSIEMIEFSKQRAALLAQEAEYECPQLDEIIRTFANIKYDHGSFKATSETIRRHFQSIEGSFGITLYGHTMNMSKEDDLLQVWRYCYDVGFLNARVADTRQKDGYRHIYPHEDPNLVSKARWNDMQATVWEIGPAYRDHLLIIQKDYIARTGLPPKGRKK
ncbi:MAG: hypothetical protein A2X57_07125 [Nitrospirae bacterium GWD2_57_8]|nr:MAG: hypothetical protein A2X57_07125 [Nitrospirae bacterium GWD2_57_8]